MQSSIGRLVDSVLHGFGMMIATLISASIVFVIATRIENKVHEAAHQKVESVRQAPEHHNRQYSQNIPDTGKVYSQKCNCIVIEPCNKTDNTNEKEHMFPECLSPTPH